MTNDLNLQEHPFRILNALPDTYEEKNGLATVDQAMIVGESQIHHGPNDNLVVYRDRPPLNDVHAQDGALRRVEDRSRQKRAENAAVRDREGAALEIGHGDLAVSSFLGQLGNPLFDVCESQTIGVAQHGDHQPFLGADGNTNVEIMVIDDVAGVDPGIDDWKAFEGFDRRLDEEGHEAESDAVFFLEGVLV